MDNNERFIWETKLHRAAADAMKKHGSYGFTSAFADFKILAKQACLFQVLTEKEVVDILVFEASRWFSVYDVTPSDELSKLRKYYF